MPRVIVKVLKMEFMIGDDVGLCRYSSGSGYHKGLKAKIVIANGVLMDMQLGHLLVLKVQDVQVKMRQ